MPSRDRICIVKNSIISDHTHIIDSVDTELWNFKSSALIGPISEYGNIGYTLPISILVIRNEWLWNNAVWSLNPA